MPRSPWPGVIAGAVALIIIAVWFSYEGKTNRKAVSAIIQAQRDIATVHEIHHTKINQEVLRAAEADLLTANTAYSQGQYDVALAAAQRTIQAVQQLLDTRPPLEQR